MPRSTGRKKLITKSISSVVAVPVTKIHVYGRPCSLSWPEVSPRTCLHPLTRPPHPLSAQAWAAFGGGRGALSV